MGILEFFKKNRKSKTEMVRKEKPSPEQILFAETALEIISPTVEKFGFERHRTEIEKHSTTIIYRKDKQYIKISSSTYPTEYPYCYNIILGVGDSEDFYEWDWNSIALWRIKNKIDPKTKSSEFDFPYEKSVKFSLENANTELKKYGLTFLNGDLELFIEVRKKQNENREPYKIHSPDKNGKYTTRNEQKSVEQKKKYS
ncbi:MAG: hypothetical protein J7K64_05685 [Bacteroidales bacterium]|nr:hypothetical protein [Bacteroidales bacterium]